MSSPGLGGALVLQLEGRGHRDKGATDVWATPTMASDNHCLMGGEKGDEAVNPHMFTGGVFHSCRLTSVFRRR